MAFGTSSPELAVTVGSAYAGEANVALGNVVGSNIFNVLFILGVSALITPLVVARQLVRLDVVVMIGASALTLLLALDGSLGRGDGLVLLAGIVAYTGFLLWQARREPGNGDDGEAAEGEDGDGSPAPSLAKNGLFVLAGLGLLVLGARWFVRDVVAAELEAVRPPVLLGGEHSVSIAAIEAAADRFPDPSATTPPPRPRRAVGARMGNGPLLPAWLRRLPWRDRGWRQRTRRELRIGHLVLRQRTIE